MLDLLNYEKLTTPTKELWQNHHDPTHAAYGIGGVDSIVHNL